MVDITNKTKAGINRKRLVAIVELFLAKNNQENKEVSIALISERKIKRLNKKYRNIDSSTDILSFEGEGDFLGELLINPNQVNKHAELADIDFQEELVFIIVHGLLHLIGYNDETARDRQKMIRLGKQFIKKIPAIL